MSAERQARAAVNASTRPSSGRSRETLLCHVLSCCTRSALLREANTRPNAAPVRATIRLSTKSNRTIRPRELPSARRTLKLAASGERPGQHQTGDVGAGDEQHEPHGHDRREERPLEARTQRRVARSRRRQGERFGESTRCAFDDLRLGNAERGVGLVDTLPRFQAHHDLQPPRAFACQPAPDLAGAARRQRAVSRPSPGRRPDRRTRAASRPRW